MTRPSTLTVGLAVPIAFTVLGVAATAVLASRAPAEIALHWGADGRPDGFGAPALLVVLVAVLGVGLSALFGALLVATVRDPWSPSIWHKILAAASSGATALVATIGVWTLASQLEPGADPSIAVGMGSSFAAGAVVGVVSWFLQPRAVRATGSATSSAAPLELRPDERAVWVGVARAATPTVAVLTLALLIVLGLCAGIVAFSGPAAWPFLLVPLLIAILMAAFARFTVRIDESGVVVRGGLGLPSWTIRAVDVASTAATRVEALSDFGGWGVRFGTGRRTGVVTRSGEALEIRRRSGRALVVTIDDAETAAALLVAYAARAGADPS
ncbi:MAG: DUF1648 domain-containing protein [Actinomycetales bacterium]|nr:DUF1648 domain-containing protein [Actinomycetales bacterium]